ncbi:peptidyl-prolyl cis-trans isomerase [Eremomyces bilateralis CBS 781.70]|uniref:peptidylprolyl isomerase n=1 Tax=Eremomyces bilateralis CBS 781.70 TaxID=1392243 RepID=A0A6G1FRN2_9PEZI|nr:peptidyl-prolyl cis-trans isomerase [Eremomyces bilateralis CBS 781.70]KAF1808437.1 peptidyl-prolyl cis-trans isomerase [Eremomyces bilateralis CBS 781.70]
MGVTKQVQQAGNGVDRPSKGQIVAMEYKGFLYDPSKPDNKGDVFDSTENRGVFKTQIGIGRVIKGWDEGIIGTASTEGMSLGEKSTLTITGDYAYGDRGFPGLIPPNATLIFDVTLKGIDDKTA